ncbi:MAG TPA: hypothetical protein VG225_02970 [Terracidiphilus sp.]|nr:hypothetical protein [Terracidiphilus sp.]
MWLRIPIPPEDFHPAAAQEPAAQRPSPDSDRISGPDVSPSAPNTAEMAPASDREIREEHAAGAMERANPDGRSDPRTMHVDPEPDAFQPSLDPAHASDGGHSGAGSGLNMATPLFAGVPILNRPNWSGRQIQAISDPDPLLIVDNPPYREWVRVLDVHSGNIGWVRKDEVRISAALK